MKMLYNKISSLYLDNPFPGKLIEYLDNQEKLISKAYLKIAKLTLFGKQNQNRLCSHYSSGLNKEPKLIFDIACGTGEHTCLLALAFPRSTIIGIDLTQRSISYAEKLKNYLNLKNVTFKNEDVKNLENIDEFKNPDLIIMSGCLHHFPNPKEILKLCFNNLNKGGYVIFGVYGRPFEKEMYITELIKNSEQLDSINKIKEMIQSLELDRNESVLNIKNEKPIFRIITSLIQFDLSYIGYVIFPHNKDSVDLDGYANPIVEYYNPRKINELVEGINYKKIEYLLPKIKFEENKFYKKMTNYEKFLFCDAKSYISSYTLKLWS